MFGKIKKRSDIKYFKPIIVLLVLSFGWHSCYYFRNEVPPIIVDEQYLVVMDRQSIPKEKIGQSFVQSGKISDTGSLNLFDTFSFRDSKVFKQLYYAKDRKYQKQYQSQWIKVIGSFSRINFGSDSKNEIKIDSLIKVPGLNEQIVKATEYCSNWVKINKNKIDLNLFKNTSRFKEISKGLELNNLNETQFVENDSLVFIDFDTQLFGIDCGKHILRQNSQRGDFLNIITIYDVGKKQIREIHITPTGYFLE